MHKRWVAVIYRARILPIMRYQSCQERRIDQIIVLARWQTLKS